MKTLRQRASEPLEITINKWYIDHKDVIFWLYKIDYKEGDYHGQYMSRKEGIWYKYEIKRLATKIGLAYPEFLDICNKIRHVKIESKRHK